MSLFVNPLLVVLGVLDETLREPQVDLALSGLDGVGTVDDVVAHVAAEVAANGAGLALHGLGGAHHLASDGDDVVALPDHGNDGGGAHEAGEAGIELLSLVLGVVLLEELHGGHHHLQTDELEALLLEASDDLADVSALDAVGLNSKKSSFTRHSKGNCGEWAVGVEPFFSPVFRVLSPFPRWILVVLRLHSSLSFRCSIGCFHVFASALADSRREHVFLEVYLRSYQCEFRPCFRVPLTASRR